MAVAREVGKGKMGLLGGMGDAGLPTFSRCVFSCESVHAYMCVYAGMYAYGRMGMHNMFCFVFVTLHVVIIRHVMLCFVMYVGVYLCMYVCMYVCMYACMYLGLFSLLQ